MSYWRCIPVLLLAGVSVALAAARKPQAAPPPPTAPPPSYPLRPSNEAAAYLDRAIAACAPDRLPEFQATYWQRVHAEPLTYEAQGTMVTTAQCFRLDLEVRREQVCRWLRIVSDGQTLWEASDGCQGPSIRRVDIPAALGGARTTPQTTLELRRLCKFPGPDRLLHELRQGTIFVDAARAVWGERPAWVLTGARLPAADGAFPNFQARQCRLVLDAQTYWPCRLEWWGPVPNAGGDVCLLEMELREPIVPRDLARTQFAFDPRDAKVNDLTASWKEQLRLRVIERRTYPGN